MQRAHCPVSPVALHPEDVESCGLSARSDRSLGGHDLSPSLDSPAPEPLVYRHDPYSDCGRVVYYGCPQVEPEPEFWGEPSCPAVPPEGTLHWALWGRVTFVPYPEEEFLAAPPPPLHGPSDMPRLFLGQLPYAVTNMQLDWLCVTFAGAQVYYPERIVKRDEGRGGAKLPTGCIHAYCDHEAVDRIVELLHKRVLFDDTGVWYAADPYEGEELSQYCQTMKDDKRRRYQHRPYDSIVVQKATSTYVPAAFFGSRHR